MDLEPFGLLQFATKTQLVCFITLICPKKVQGLLSLTDMIKYVIYKELRQKPDKQLQNEAHYAFILQSNTDLKY